MKITLDKSFARLMKNRLEGYEFEVGVLDDKTHLEPKSEGGVYEYGTFAGGPIRKPGRKLGKNFLGPVRPLPSTGEVLIANMERLGINILARPFEEQSSDIIKFTTAFLRSAVAKASMKRVENLLQAVVRNPILRGEYGRSSGFASDEKGFDRPLIDTAQMFKAIKAKVKRV